MWRERIEVVTASDGLAALAAVADAQPDLMLLDFLLPRIDGYQVFHVVRHHPDFRNLPILLLSGEDSVLDRLRGWMAGSTDHISKPFNTPTVWERAARRAQGLQQPPKRWWRR